MVPNSLSKMFARGGKSKCQRCGERVYQVEKIGPVNEVVFHRQCFKCAVCGQHLTVKTYYTNQLEFGDKEIYCWTHSPRSALFGCDADAVGIQNALRTPGASTPFSRPVLPTGHTPIIGGDAITIAHPVNVQSQLNGRYRRANGQQHCPDVVVSGSVYPTEVCVIFKWMEQVGRRHYT